jgi:hypothetical protein
MQLKSDFAFTSIPEINRRPRLSLSDSSIQLGPLQDLKGTWAGKGFNAIWRPFHGTSPVEDHFLELNLTDEMLQLDEIPGPIPNRGLLQDDITMFGLLYLQQITDVNMKDATGKPAGLHLEPGIWAMVPTTTHPQVGQTVVRMASIPHGTTVIAQGTATLISEPPAITNIDITPFEVGNSAKKVSFAESDLTKDSNFRSRREDMAGVTQDMVDNPNSFLMPDLQKKIIKTVVLDVSSSASNPVPGGGVANTAFLEGSPNEGPNAKATLVRATFWIETIEGDAGGPEVQQLQYSQIVLLNFNNLIWPHVSVATLQRVLPREQPVGIEPLSVRDI